MVNRSRAEKQWVAYLCDVLGLGTTTQTILGVLNEGFERNRFDAYIDLGSVHVYAEYDGGWYHNAERCEYDLQKSRRAVDNDPLAIVIRVRVKAAPMVLDPSDARIVVVHVDHTRMHELIKDTARALQSHVPEPYATRLRRTPCQKRPVAEDAATEVEKCLDKKFARDLERLTMIVGKDNANKMSKVHGARTLMDREVFAENVQRLKTELELDTAQLVKIMNICVANRMEKESFRTALRSVKAEFELDTAQLLTIMNNCFAKRIEKESFRTALRSLKAEFELDTAQLVKIMNDCVANSIENESFRTAMRSVKAEFELNTAQLVTIMNGCFANRIENESFRTALRYVKAEFELNTAQLVTLMNDCVANSIENESFRIALRSLKAEFELDTAQLVKIMTGCVANRMENESFRTAMRSVKAEFELDTVQLVTIMSNCFANRIEKVSFRTAMRYVKAEFELNTAQLVTLMSDDCVAARIENESFVNRLRSERVLTRKRMREISGEYRVVRPCVA